MNTLSIPRNISTEELSAVLGISEKTIKILVKTNQLPFKKEKNKIYFDFNEIMEHFRTMEGGAA